MFPTGLEALYDASFSEALFESHRATDAVNTDRVDAQQHVRALNKCAATPQASKMQLDFFSRGSAAMAEADAERKNSVRK